MPALADERILSFDSAITVQRDGTLEVRETIRVRAEGQNIRRGIVREFPTTYPAKDGRQIVVGFAFDSATRDGNPEPWRTEAYGNGIRIYLGSASEMLPHGEHTYEIVYRTDRQMGFFADHDELYWNATGNGSNFPIEKASARVTLPAEIPAGDLRLEAYTGFQDQQGQNFTAQLTPAGPHFVATRELRPKEGLTIVVMWPKGFITAAVENALPATPSQSASPGYDYGRDAGGASDRTYSSPAEGFLRRTLPHDSRPVLFGLIGLGLLLAYYYLVWDKVGRDPPGRVIIPEYEMPEKQSAASMRYLLRMNYDDECFAASVLSLAVKGYLRIEETDGILGLGKKYTLTKETAENPKPLSSDELALLSALFKHGNRLELEQENHAKVSGARSAHYSSLKGQYKSTFFNINGGWHLLGIALSLLVGVFALTWPGAADVWPAWYLTTPLGWLTIFTVILALVANGVFGKLLKAPTVAGQVAMDHIRGFKAYLEVAEGGDLKRINAPPPKMTAQLYETYLPAALALDVDQRWAEKFARVLAIEAPNYHPAWYVGSGWNPARVASFSSGLGSSLSSAISSSSQAPGSKSGGGGGGRAGGGGGGGGVGGW